MDANNKSTKRIAAALAVGAAATGLAVAGAGMASAGTVPVRPGYVTSTMTIVNNSNATEYLNGSQPDGQWVKAPRAVLRPGQSEIVTATGPGAQSIFIDYRLGAGDSHAIYRLQNGPGNANTFMTMTTGMTTHYINATLDTGYPVVNAGYELW